MQLNVYLNGKGSIAWRWRGIIGACCRQSKQNPVPQCKGVNAGSYGRRNIRNKAQSAAECATVSTCVVYPAMRRKIRIGTGREAFPSIVWIAPHVSRCGPLFFVQKSSNRREHLRPELKLTISYDLQACRSHCWQCARIGRLVCFQRRNAYAVPMMGGRTSCFLHDSHDPFCRTGRNSSVEM